MDIFGIVATLHNTLPVLSLLAVGVVLLLAKGRGRARRGFLVWGLGAVLYVAALLAIGLAVAQADASPPGGVGEFSRILTLGCLYAGLALQLVAPIAARPVASAH